MRSIRQRPPTAQHLNPLKQGRSVRYVRAAKFVNELVEAADERQPTKTIARYGRVDLVAIDEL